MMKKIQYVPLRKGQMDKYLEMAKRENVYPIIYIGLQCGLRQSELISLPWAAVDFSERVIRGKHHAVDLDEESERLLRTEQAAHPKSDTVNSSKQIFLIQECFMRLSSLVPFQPGGHL